MTIATGAISVVQAQNSEKRARKTVSVPIREGIAKHEAVVAMSALVVRAGSISPRNVGPTLVRAVMMAMKIRAS